MLKKYWLLCLLMAASSLRAHPVRVAVAANAQHVLKLLANDFEQKHGFKIEIIAGSSGKLTAQIKNGAPYHIFLSADMVYPITLFKKGFGITAPKTYALGSLIVCSSVPENIHNWQSAISENRVAKVAIANPRLAPYGKAAQEALNTLGIWEKVQPKVVFGESISQTNTYLISGAVPMAFTSESLIYESKRSGSLKWQRINRRLYSPIKQGVLFLTYSRKNNYQRALKFYNYLLSNAARQVFRTNGYFVP